ncbi:MHYT domain-containing protein [Marinitenerispora sediminis]|uniref:MHYT domain-containing protein n=1 Tax=Marinitenerispora sediminis TaxID=1931232 RepID=UPI001314DB4D|nr:MHYT domain-containing protein [Marinitenerispora sediminis]
MEAAAEIDHFSYGWVTPALAYLSSFVGALVALLATSRARPSDGARRVGWLAVAAVALGCSSIWSMHFIAMLGFDVHGTAIRYDVGLTVLSLVLAVLVVGLGLAVVTAGRGRLWSLAVAGPVTGLGVAAMHYTGMSSIQMHGTVHHDRTFVVLSVVIAVVAATAALWAALYVRGRPASVAAALVMGVAVCAMHYTAMAGTGVELVPDALLRSPPPGAAEADFVLPLLLGVGLPTILLVQLLLVTDNERQIEQERTTRRRFDALRRAAEEPEGTEPRGAAAPAGPDMFSAAPAAPPDSGPAGPPRGRR